MGSRAAAQAGKALCDSGVSHKCGGARIPGPGQPWITQQVKLIWFLRDRSQQGMCCLQGLNSISSLPWLRRALRSFPCAQFPIQGLQEGREGPLGLEHVAFQRNRESRLGDFSVTLGTDFSSLQVISQHLFTAAGFSFPIIIFIFFLFEIRTSCPFQQENKGWNCSVTPVAHSQASLTLSALQPRFFHALQI